MSGQWGTVTLGVPDFLEDVRDAINTIADFLVSVLDIVLASLQLVKSFLVGYIDPLLSFLQLIIDYITNLLRDLRSLGIYMCGDWALVNYPFKQLRGGYKAYERRMVSRMVDISDPTRPITSSDTKVFSVWFYLSVDISDIERLIRFIRQIMKFFGQDVTPIGTPPIPKITSVLYSADAATILAPKELGEYFKPGIKKLPDTAVVKWKVEQPASENMFKPFPAPPPKGFIVSVSTFENGIPLFFDRPLANSGTAPSSIDATAKVQPRESGVVVDSMGQPVILYGGHDQITGFDDFSYNGSLDVKGNVISGKTRIFGMLSPASQTVIDMKDLGSKDNPHFQRFFYVPSKAVNAQFMLGEFTASLKLDLMPSDGHIKKDSIGKMEFVETEKHASQVFVRVASCSKDVASGKTPFQYDLSSDGSLLAPTDKSWQITAPGMINSVDVGPFSEPVAITFPNTHTQDYFNAIRAAMIVLALSRPDLQTFDEVKDDLDPVITEQIKQKKTLLPEVALTECGLEGYQHLLGYAFKKDPALNYNSKDVISPVKFKETLIRLIDIFIYDSYKSTGPRPEVEKAVIENTQYLRSVTWKQLMTSAGIQISNPDDTVWDSTIVDSLSNMSLDNGLALNRNSLGLPADKVQQLTDVKDIYKMRHPQFMEAKKHPDTQYELPLQYDSIEALFQAKKDYPEWVPVLDKAVPDNINDPSDTGWVIPSKYHPFIQKKLEPTGYYGSADDIAPVFYMNRSSLLSDESPKPNECGIIFCRGLFAKANEGQILSEAQYALNAAASVLVKPPQDGAWISSRFLARYTAIEDFAMALESWLSAVKETMQSIVDSIKKYIEFLEGRIIELQQLIQNINNLIQSVLRNLVQIPQAAALVLYSDGTDGMLADFVAAKQKPKDSPLAYGVGVGVVIPVPLVGLVGDIIKALFNTESGSDAEAEGMPPGAITPSASGKAKDESEEPDVL